MIETNNWEVTIQDVVKTDVDAGDTLLVTLPPQTETLSMQCRESFARAVGREFRKCFEDTKIKVLVVMPGTEVRRLKPNW